MILLTALFVPACSVANCKECSASDSVVYLTCETDFVVKENAFQCNSFFVLNFTDIEQVFQQNIIVLRHTEKQHPFRMLIVASGRQVCGH